MSEVYPALARVPPELFGICVAAVDGRVHSVGDAEVEFTMMSVAKPFAFALVCDVLGPDEIQRRVGVNATGLPFQLLEAVEHAEDGRTNPMVNPGAIATASFAPGRTAAEKWEAICDGLSRCAGRRLELDREVFASASATNHGNRGRSQPRWAAAAGWALRTGGCGRRLHAAELPGVTARDLALMGATLADGGVQPLTGEQVMAEDTCRYVLTVMTTAGLYETSGDWLYDVGLRGEERDRRRHRDGVAGKGRPRHLRAAARRGGQPSCAGSSWRGSCRVASASTCSPRAPPRPSPRSLRGAAAGRAPSSRGGPRLGRYGRDHGPRPPVPRQAAHATGARPAPQARPRRAGGGRGLLPCPTAAARGRDRVPRAVLARAARDRARLDRRHRAAGRQPSRGGDRLDRRPAAVRRGRVGPRSGTRSPHAAREPHERAGPALARRVLLGVHGDDGGAPERPRGGARGSSTAVPPCRPRSSISSSSRAPARSCSRRSAITVVAQNRRARSRAWGVRRAGRRPESRRSWAWRCRWPS